MGLDVLHHGGYASMVSLQRSLILLLCLFAAPVYAEFPQLPEGGIVFWSKSGSKDCYDCSDGPSPGESLSAQAQEQLPSCAYYHPDKECLVQSYDDPPEFLYNDQWGNPKYRVRGAARVIAVPRDCASMSHEPHPVTGESPVTCTCSEGWTSKPSGSTSPYQCVLPKNVDQCAETGMAYDDETQQCTEYCEWGMLDGVCMSPPPAENDDDCNADSPNFRGQIGFGANTYNFCSKDVDGDGTEDRPNECQTGSGGKGALGFVNNELRCVPDDYADGNICDVDEIFIIDDYGVICSGLDNVPEEPKEEEQPNTDTDGDGQPDEYNPDNDPNVNRKQLDELIDGQGKSNDTLGNIEKIGKGTNDRLDGIGKELENNSKGIGEVVGFTRQINEKLDISDNATGPSLPEEGTVGESLDRMNAAIFGHPTVDAFTTIPQLPSVTTCPVYTIPATKWTEPLTMDMHCIILEENRSILSLIMVAVWSLTAIAVFLRA